MAYEHTTVAVSKTQEGLRSLLRTHKGFGLAVISEQDPAGKDAALEGFQAKVMIDNVPYVFKIMAKVKAPSRYASDRQKSDFREQEERRIWRVLYYHMKSVFEASDSGVMEFREMMLPYIVNPKTGKTIAQYILPQLDAMLLDPSRLLTEGSDNAK